MWHLDLANPNVVAAYKIIDGHTYEMRIERFCAGDAWRYAEYCDGVRLVHRGETRDNPIEATTDARLAAKDVWE